MCLSRAMRSLYLEVFFRNCHAMTLRCIDTAISAVRGWVARVRVNIKFIAAGSEMTPLHMKSRHSIAIQGDKCL